MPGGRKPNTGPSFLFKGKPVRGQKAMKIAWEWFHRFGNAVLSETAHEIVRFLLHEVDRLSAIVNEQGNHKRRHRP